MGVGSGAASGEALRVVSGVGVASTCGDIVASAGTAVAATTGGSVAAGAAVGDGTGPDEQAATATAAIMKTTIDILRIDSTFPFL